MIPDDLAQAVLAREDVARYLRSAHGGSDGRERVFAYLEELRTTQRYPFYRALKAIKALPAKTAARAKTRVILMSAKGKRFTHEDAVRLSKYKRVVLLCGRYEGVDERVAQNLIDEELSIGDFVLTGGELPAMTIIDAVSRHIPGVLGKAESLSQESHTEEGVTEYPQYTRPESFSPKRGAKWDVPQELLSGNHAEIAKWREKQRNKKTASK